MRGMELSDREKEIYRRQISLPEWGEETQAALKGSTVFIAGAGGLGSAAILYLAAAGVGRLRVCDRDTVELSNLNRQVLHSERVLGMNKAASARRSVVALNKHVRVEALTAEISGETVADLIGPSRIILDCLDDMPARRALNQHAVREGVPLVHAGVRGLRGQLTFIHHPETPCLACLLLGSVVTVPPESVSAGQDVCITAGSTAGLLTSGSAGGAPAGTAAPLPSIGLVGRATAGPTTGPLSAARVASVFAAESRISAGPPPILGATAGVMGCLQAVEALKYLAGRGDLLKNRILFWDGDSMKFEVAKIVKNPGCPVCGIPSG